ncbi:MAG: hypothetical protein IJJ99_03600 [Oscillospiraceae bacterium]|nr:hypothetical protein [Oscillospiraceae bacterium]
MCWILHGALKGGVDPAALEAINKKHVCHLSAGTKHDVKTAVLSCNGAFRLTDGCCDCESDVGRHDPDAAQVRDLAALIAEAGALPGAESVSLCKAWDTQRNKRECVLKLSELDLRQLFADFEPGTLYTISCQT